MNFLTEKLGFEPELNQGLIASVVFHIALFLFAWFGVPHLFQDDFIEQPMGLKGALISDITAAPKVDKASNKLTEKPKKTQKVEPPKKETKPAAAKENPKPAAAPPPPAPEEVAVAIPDKEKPVEKKPEEKKPEEKKVEEKPKKKPEEKKKPTKKDTNELDSLLASVLQDQAAEPTPEKPEKKAAPAPEEPSEGPQTPELSAVALSASDADNIGQQIGSNWAVDVGALPDPSQYIAMVRVKFDGQGTVLSVDYLEKGRMSDPKYRMVAESCRRAFFITQRVQFPPGKEQPVITFGCDPQYAN
jgi:hypothetical protein